MLFVPIHPPRNPDECPQWLYEAIKRLNASASNASTGFSAIVRGEAPDGSGSPLGLPLPNEPGAVLFIGSGPMIKTDVRHFFYDDRTDSLGLGTTTPSAVLDITQPAVVTVDVPSSTLGVGLWLTNPGGGTNLHTAIDETVPDDADYIEQVGGQPIGGGCIIGLTGSLVGQTSVVLKIRAKAIIMNGLGTCRLLYQLSGNSGNLPEVALSDFQVNTSFSLVVNRTLTPAEIATLGTSLSTITFRGDETNAFTGSNGGWRLAVSSVIVELATTAPTNLTRWSYNSALVSQVDYHGWLGLGTGSTALNNLLTVQSDSTGRLPVLIQGFASQSEALTAWNDSTGTRMSSVTANGYFSTKQLLLNGSTSGTLTHVPAATTTSHTLTWPSTQGAANTLLANNGSGTLSWVSVSSLTADFADNAFTIHDQTNTTAKIAFELAGISSGTTRTLTPQNASYTLAGINLAQTFTTTQTVAPATDVAGLVIDGSNISTADMVNISSGGTTLFTVDAGGIINFQNFRLHNGSIGSGSDTLFDPVNLSASRTYNLPDANVTLVGRTGTIATGRIPFFNGSTAAAALATDSDLSFSVDTLTVTKIAATQFTGNITIADAINFIFNATTGTKIGTATTQKLAFWNAAPITQPTTAVAAATRTGGGGTTLTDTDTFDGYTVAQVVKALRNTGLLA